MTRPIGKGLVLMDDVTITTDPQNSDPFTTPEKKFGEMVAQIDITGGSAVTVQIQGRLSANHAWVDLLDTAQTQAVASDIYAIAWVPELRVNTVNGSGNPVVRVEVYHG